jgi:hypothetical protein
MINGELVRLKNAVTKCDHISGRLGAPITLVEYGNFQCIHCGDAYSVIKELRNVLGDCLLFAFRHFPTVRTHPLSMRAAEASEAAGAQGKFWEMHDELFSHQQALEDHDLLRYGKRIGLDVERFGRDMDENSFLKIVEAEFNRSLFDEHVTGTPTFYINGVRYTDATDIESLLSAMQQADTEDCIRLPRRASGMRGALQRLRRSAIG